MQILLQLKCVITLEVYCDAWPMGWGVCLCSAVRGLMAVTIGECWWSHAKGKRCSRRTGPSPLVSILMYSLPRNSKKLILSDSFPVTPGNVKYLAVSPFFQSHFRYVHILPFFFFFLRLLNNWSTLQWISVRFYLFLWLLRGHYNTDSLYQTFPSFILSNIPITVEDLS